VIARVRGEVVERTTDRVVVDVGGVGLAVLVPRPGELPAPGQHVELRTSLQVREDSLTLYGFEDPAALTMFELLLSSSGVGPRLALAALATHAPAALAAAIAAGDVATMTAVPGIGRKLADRIVLELADRMPAVAVGSPPAVVAGGVGEDERIAAVRSALVGFGFSVAEVTPVLAELAASEADEVPALLRRALRALDGSRIGSPR
jgi:holliday junction DNA helicase RuvA